MRNCLLRASEAAFPGRVAFLGCCEVGAVQAFPSCFLKPSLQRGPHPLWFFWLRFINYYLCACVHVCV